MMFNAALSPAFPQLLVSMENPFVTRVGDARGTISLGAGVDAE
jgi:hypothetical protein